jgi:drug/metabolite transporter (DMT)-like permease
MNKNKTGIVLAIAAAALYAISTPVSKLLLFHIPSTILAGLLYLGAGVGMGCVALVFKNKKIGEVESKLSKDDLPYTIAMIVLDIAAPILLLLGLVTATPENVSLLNNFEIVATSLIAFIFFGEKISKRLGIAIVFIAAASAILSFESGESLKFSVGSLLVLAAACCWGLENNCTRKLSDKDPMQIVIVKGICSGAGSLIIGLAIGERIDNLWYIIGAIALGFVAYGLSIFVYVYAQRLIGAARTSAYYAVAPFIGSALSIIIFGEMPRITFFIAAAVMGVGTYLASKD